MQAQVEMILLDSRSTRKPWQYCKKLNLAMFLMPLWFVLFSEAWPWLAAGCLFKSMADFLMLYRIAGVTGQRRDLKRFIPVVLLYYPFFMVTLAGVLLGKQDWKGNTM